ncbi:hypothetical protein PC121_g4994 [Phytophthora cactorum]|nr:hypothetical protein PC121_g4994 [Phytophthora cactorum]
MTGTNELRLVESSFLLWRKAVAATHRIREFRAKSTRRQWLALVAMVFRSWKRRSNTNVHCRKLLASVAVGNHLRFRFMLWQWFTTHRKRLANLLLIVADPTAETSSPTLENDDNESGIVIRDELECPPPNWTLTGDQALVTLGQKLAQKARVLQRFDVTWDLPQAWHRWRQIFHAHLFYRMRRQQFFFILWQRFARQQRRNRFIIIKLTIQRRAASLLTVFRAWAELVTRVKQLQKDRLRERELWILVTTEMARRERRQLKKHWHAWKFHVGESRHLQKIWRYWNRATLASQLRRGEQLEQAAEHEMATLLRHSLGVWQMAAKKQRERRFVLLSCIVKLQSVAGHHILEIVFQSWKRVVDCRRRCGAALLKRERRIAKNVFIYWLRGIRERQRRREQLQSAEIYHSQRLKSSFFFYWQTYALAWQDAAKPIARRHYRQMVLPTRIVADTHGESESEDEVRRPTSPVMKRLRQKKANRTRSAEKVGEESDMVTLSDAVEISMDVKKRLLLLGKWKSRRLSSSR